jgi:hypothetical protein
MGKDSEGGKKGGRPVQAVKKQVRITVRFSKAEYFIIQGKANRAGLKPSAWLRQAGINGGTVPRLTREEGQFVRSLSGIENNINQIAKACHKEGAVAAAAYFEEYRIIVNGLLKKLRS